MKEHKDMLEASSNILNLKKTIKDASAKVKVTKRTRTRTALGLKMAPRRSMWEAELLIPQA
jgi:hypothetical protein